MNQWLRCNVKWKKWTYHHKTHLVYLATTSYGRVYTYHGQDYLVNDEGEVGKIPFYVSLSVRGITRATRIWGPYIFYNGFETTSEAEYLMKMFRYKQLTPVAAAKVAKIRSLNTEWIGEDKDFIEALEAREHE